MVLTHHWHRNASVVRLCLSARLSRSGRRRTRCVCLSFNSWKLPGGGKKRYYVTMWKNAFWKPLSFAANDVWVPVFAPADNNEGADDDADERDADSYSDPRHRLLVQMVEAIGKTWRGFKAGCTSASKRFEIESERPALSCALTSGVGGAARESVVAARGEVCSHRQLHRAGKRSVAHSVGRRNLHQVNVARLQVLQQSHGGGSCWNDTRLWGFLPVRLSCNLGRRRQISLTINIKIPRSRVNSLTSTNFWFALYLLGS